MTEMIELEVIDGRSPVDELEHLQVQLEQAEQGFDLQIKLILTACYHQFMRLRTDYDEWGRLVLAAKACGALKNNVPFGDPAKMMRLIVRFVAHRQNKSRSQLFKYAAALIAVFNEQLAGRQVEERIGSLLIEDTYKRNSSRFDARAAGSNEEGSSVSGAVADQLCTSSDAGQPYYYGTPSFQSASAVPRAR